MTIWPSDNEYGIPTLDLRMQATVEPPVCAWGYRSRRRRMRGTWVFYVDDYRFNQLLKRPGALADTECVAAVEPNLSLYDDSAKAEVIWATYRKRLVAREWQAYGIRIFVDLNVPARYLGISLLGVPEGWTSYATRGYASRLDDLKREHDAAVLRAAGETPTLLVYGGGNRVRDACTQLSHTVWVPSHQDAGRLVGTAGRLIHRTGGVDRF